MFKCGDVVRLRSGGPVMTIEGVAQVNRSRLTPIYVARCVWFEGNTIHANNFLFEMLGRVE